MKKKIIGCIAVVMIATITAFNINLNTDNKEMSLLTMANIEALADLESVASKIKCEDYCVSPSRDICRITVTDTSTGKSIDIDCDKMRKK